MAHELAFTSPQAGNRFQFSTSNKPASVCTSRAWLLPPVQGQSTIGKKMDQWPMVQISGYWLSVLRRLLATGLRATLYGTMGSVWTVANSSLSPLLSLSLSLSNSAISALLQILIELWCGDTKNSGVSSSQDYSCSASQQPECKGPAPRNRSDLLDHRNRPPRYVERISVRSNCCCKSCQLCCGRASARKEKC